MKKKFSNNKGFSLVELIIVVAIMAILIGILAPQYMKYVERSRLSADNDMIDSVRKAVETAMSDPDSAQSAGFTITFSATQDTTDPTAGEVAEIVNGTTQGKTGETLNDTQLRSKTYRNGTAPDITVTFNSVNGVLEPVVAVNNMVQ